jgi:hypothetical protein
VFAGPDRWLQTEISPPGLSIYTTLLPRQPLTPAPYALYAQNAGTVMSNSINSDKIAPGAVGSAQLADVIDLGATNSNGQLLIYRTAANTPAIGLYGVTSSLITYGSDGLEQTKLWGATYGELLLHNSLANNATAVQLSANGPAGGHLWLNNSNGQSRAEIVGDNAGGSLSLFQGDGNMGVYLAGDNGGAGFVSVRATNGSTVALMNGLNGGAIQSANTIEAAGKINLVNSLGGPIYASLEKNGSGGGAFRTYDELGNTTTFLASYATGGGGLLNIHMSGSIWPGVTVNGDDGNSGAILVKAANDATRIKLDGHNGVSSQITMYHTNGTKTVDLVAGEDSNTGSQLLLYQKNGTRTIEVDGEAGLNGGGYLGIYHADGTAAIEMWSKYSDNKARIITPVIQITGGADLSEQFDVASRELKPEPGMVMCIDPEHPGKLRVSDRAFDRTVAGVISGAGGVEPGMMMGHSGTLADGQLPVALTGRVYVKVDAESAPIQPGDLLTTSATPGHAMKVTDPSRAQGAILGKAMTALARGKGLVLVLVTLQ